MAEEKAETTGADRAQPKDEVALELMKFIAVTTGYGKVASSDAGFMRQRPHALPMNMPKPCCSCLNAAGNSGEIKDGPAKRRSS
jgi:hypothetical protein